MPNLTRRRALALLPAAAVAAHGQMFKDRKPKPHAEPAHPFVYFGTDTAHGGKGIYAARFDPTTGHFTQPQLAAETLRPVWLAWNTAPAAPTHRVMYVTNEGDAHTSTISTFLLDPASGALKLIGQVPTAGAGPCYLGVDASGHFAYIANYNGGTVTAYQVQRDGTLSQPAQSIDFHDAAFGTHGPNAARQDGPHPHSAMLSPDNRFLIVNDLGTDNIALFPIAPNGRLGTPTLTHTRANGAGPRHLAFHPNGRWAYGVDELSNQVDCYLWNSTHASSATGAAQAFLTATGVSLSTLDSSFHAANTAAEVAVSPEGRELYVSNRGEETLVVYKINETNGSITFDQRIPIGGKGPRQFTLDPTGHWLICGNQNSDSVTVFARHESTGRLTGPIQTLQLPSPVFILFA